MRISDWSSDVCSSDLLERAVDLADQLAVAVAGAQFQRVLGFAGGAFGLVANVAHFVLEVLDGLLGLLDQVRAPLQQALAEVLELKCAHVLLRSEEHTSELQSLMRSTYAVFCLKKK